MWDLITVIVPNELQMVYGGSFYTVYASDHELEDVGWFSFSIRAV